MSAEMEQNQEQYENEIQEESEIRALSKKLAALQSMCNLLDWEMQAGDYVWKCADSGKDAMRQLRRLRRELILSKETEKLLRRYGLPGRGEPEETPERRKPDEPENVKLPAVLDSQEAAELRELAKIWRMESRFSGRQAQRQENICEQAGKAWEEAFQKKDQEKEKEYLEHLAAQISLLRETMAEGEGYERFLSDYEPCYSMAEVDAFFEQCRTELRPLLQERLKKQKKVTSWRPEETYEPERQYQLAKFLGCYLGFDFNRGRIGQSVHPFTTAVGISQVCWSDRYVPDNPFAAIFSALHEAGHAIYEQNVGKELSGTILDGGCSSAMHEAVARFYENCIGRRRDFWEPIFGKVTGILGGEFERISFDDFMDNIQRVKPCAVRTQACELSYFFHILIRYELERDLISGRLPAAELPAAWKRKYKDYLGVVPARFEDGYLQDIHWSCGQFGYFPAYQMGNAIAAQIYRQVKQALPLSELLKEGKLSRLKNYLATHIFRYGMTKTSDEILYGMTGETLQTKYYLEYLRERYGENGEMSLM